MKTYSNARYKAFCNLRSARIGYYLGPIWGGGYENPDMQQLSDRVTAGYQVERQEVVDALGWQMRRIERGNNVSGGRGGDVT